MRAVKDEIKKLPADGKHDLYEALVEYGAGLKGYARILAMMIQGIRPYVEGDRAQQELNVEDRFKPKLVEIDGETFVRIDATTQMQAMKLYAEVLGLKETGVRVNVNTGHQINGARELMSLGDLFLAAKSGEGSDARLRAAVQALPPEQRRVLAAAMKSDARDVIDVQAIEHNGSES